MKGTKAQHIALCYILLGVLLPVMATTASRHELPSPHITTAADVADGNALLTDNVAWLVSINNEIADKYFHLGEWDKTVEALDRVIALDPSGTDPYATAAWLLWSQDHNDEAMSYYNRMIEANPTDPQGYFEIGFFYNVRQHDALSALPWLEKAVALGLPSPKCHLYGHVLMELGRNDAALAFWKKVLEADPKDTVARRNIVELTAEKPKTK